jgi:outer membrane murein-binding lipoprotein Lpp
MTFSKFSAAVLLALLAGCASNAPKKDAYAEAAATKRAEIDRLSRRIDSLRVLPTTEEVDRQLDSLRARRSLEAGNLQGLGSAVEEERKMRQEQNVIGLQTFDSTRLKKYPIQKP